MERRILLAWAMVTRVDTHGKRHQAIHLRCVCLISVVQVRESGMVIHTGHPSTQEAEIMVSQRPTQAMQQGPVSKQQNHTVVVSGRISIAVIKHGDQKQLGEIGLISAYNSQVTLHHRGRAGYSKQELKHNS